MTFKKNLHLAKNVSHSSVVKKIKDYPKQYPVPKYLIFMNKMLKAGWKVKIYVAGVSKYVFIKKGDGIFKIRFSNHKPLFNKEVENDCDFYVGISHTQVSTTEEIMKKLIV